MNKGWDLIVYSGVGHAGVVNRLLSENISVRRARSVGNRLYLTTNTSDRRKIIVLFDSLCYNYQITKSKGLFATAEFVKNRPIIPVGIILIFLMLCLLPNFVYTVRVDSGSIGDDAVIRVLAEHGIYKGVPAGRVDEGALELALTDIAGVAFADVDISGSTLTIRLFEELPPVNIFDTAANDSVVSRFDAVISRQIVFSGTAVKQKGEVVRAGDTLIAGSFAVGEAEVKTHATGEVYGLVTYKASIYFTETSVKRQKSGRTETESVISFLGLTGKPKGSPFEMYETRTESVKGGFLLPITLNKITYYEIVDMTITESFAQAEGRLREEALAEAMKGIPADAVIVGRQTTIREIGGSTVVEAVITAEHRIDIAPNE